MVGLKKQKIHIIGTHGVPANYGGFETLADHLCRQLGERYELTVYCSSKSYKTKQSEFYGAKLHYINIEASGFKGIFYDIKCYLGALRKADVILYLGPSGSGFIIPLRIFTKTKVIVNHGGFNEWEREKLNWVQRTYARINHRIACRFAHFNIADNELYQKSLAENFNAKSVVIKYGSDQVQACEVNRFSDKYSFLTKPYIASVSRAQVDNKLHLLLESFSSFSKYPLVLVSNWNVSAYGKELKEKYSNHPNIILLDAIYDQDELNCIRGNALAYIHSHSFCGTAPSLIEAMHLGRAIISYDVPVNRETTQGKAEYFKTSNELIDLLNNLTPEEISSNQSEMSKLAHENYEWKKIGNQYAELIDSFQK